jgi:hypothetical protein
MPKGPKGGKPLFELVLFGAGKSLGGLLCGRVDSLGIEQLTKH